MVRCRSKKCQEAYQAIVDNVMLTVPKQFRYDYSEVRNRAKPHIQKHEWLNWLGRNPK